MARIEIKPSDMIFGDRSWATFEEILNDRIESARQKLEICEPETVRDYQIEIRVLKSIIEMTNKEIENGRNREH